MSFDSGNIIFSNGHMTSPISYDLYHLYQICMTTKLKVMEIYGWELLLVYHHPDKSCDHNQCDGGDVFNFSRDLLWTILKGLYEYEFMGGSPSHKVTTMLCLVAMGL